MKTCPQCHTPLDEDAPEGLCPRCLAAAAFHSDPTIVTGGPDGLPDIANAEEVARRLPQYEILELLGRGGMGVVYKARQKQLDRIVALKILPPSDALSPDFIERFRREARSLAKLSHANIVAIHDFGEAGGLYYFAMEYVDGANLREMLRTKKMSGAEALAVVPKICDALQYAHDEGVVHRDIKPENILVDLKGRVKIADFGLAKLLRRDDTDQNLTLSGMALGTPRYMAPEQVDKPETVDHRADIYSLGVVFYEMLTGELPMGRFAPPSQKVQVDVRLDEIVLHALERDVERRYQRVGDVKTDVENVTGKPQFAPSPSSETQPPLDPRSMQPRFSGHAIVGAFWAVFGLLAILSGAYFVALSHVWNGTALPTDLIHESPPMGFNIFMGALLVIGSGAFIGTPVLGAVAIGRIRRSEGRLIGLPIAVADVLFTPFTAIGGLCALLSRRFLGPAELVIVVLPLCFLMARATWRSIANRTGKNSLPANGAKPETGSDNPRLSRLALVGSILVAIGTPIALFDLCAVLDLEVGSQPLERPAAMHAPIYTFGHEIWVSIVFSLIALFIAAILGGFAIDQIKRSAGKIYGLPLAAMDLLFFPLLLLGAFAFWFTHLVQVAVWTKVHTAYIDQPGNPEVIIAPPPQAYPGMSFMILDTVVALVICFVAGFAAWRAISGRTGQKAHYPEVAVVAPAKVVRTPADLLVLVASIALLTAVSIGIWFWGQGALHPDSGSAFGDNTPTIVPIKGGQMIVTGQQQGIIIKVSAVIIVFYGIIIGGAGLLMRRLRARIFVLISLVLAGLFLPAALAYNFISEHVPQWPMFAAMWLGMPVCVWALRLLFREEIRDAFETPPEESVDTRTPEKQRGGWSWPLAICLAGVIACAFPCQRMTSGFWGMPWWSSETTGVGAMSVVPDSPAAKAGILPEDHVKELNGTKLTGGDTLFQMWKNLPVGAAVEMKIERVGKPMTLTTRREPDSLAGQFYWNWQIIAGHAFLVFGGLVLVARRRPSLASGFSLIAGAGALVLLACVVPMVDATMVGPSLWKNAAFGEGSFEQWPWQRVTVVIVCGMLAVMSLGAINREAVEPDLVLGGAGLAAFGISLAWGICRLTGTMTNLEWAAILLTILTAIGVAVLFPRPRRGEPGSMRSKMPEIVLVLLGAGVGALPWTHTLLPTSGWQFWHGGIFSMIYFVLGLVLLASGGSRPAPWMGVVTILAALGAFACAFAFTTWPPEWHLFSDGTGTSKVRTLMAGVFVAYGLSVLTAAMGALQIRAAAANAPSVPNE